MEWHTYENKQTRPIRVMARNLHPSCSPEMIKEDLGNKNFKILEVVNKFKITKENGIVKRIPLPLFMLTFQNSEDIKKIYEIPGICGMLVKIEALRSNKLIPQCKNCQRYGHTRKFCQRTPTCVRCAGDHPTSTCDKPKNIPPKCSNCSEAHPANYRGCLIAKELQKRRNNTSQTRMTEKSQPKTFVSKNVTKEVTYAQATQSKSSSQSTSNQKEEPFMKQMLQDIINMMNKFSDRLDRLEVGNSSFHRTNNGPARP